MASQSPRRRELLKYIGLEDFKIVNPDVDETPPAGVQPWQTACVLSLRKARAVRAGSDDIVIAADTIVVLEGNILGKPHDEVEAFSMLNMLSGLWHEVITGVTVLSGGSEQTAYVSTAVKFRELSAQEIEAYIRTGEPMDKAGAYGAQSRGALFVERIEGDFYNIVGLPLELLGRMLTEAGVTLLA